MIEYLTTNPLSVLIFTLAATNVITVLQNMGLITPKSAEEKLKLLKAKNDKITRKATEQQARLMAQMPK